ncbi:hypothetical protein GCM10023238_16340 [Streptomyces heliomycini]
MAFAEPGLGAGELLRNADLAMYRAKAAGKGRVELYKPQMQQDVVRRAELATRLRAALHHGEFALLHQPVVCLEDGRITSVCAQARWRSSQGVLFTPAEFLRVAEDSEKTAELGRWVLEEAVEQAAERHMTGLPVPVAVRLSAHRLLDRSLPLGSIEALLTPARAAVRLPGRRAGRHRPRGVARRAGAPADRAQAARRPDRARRLR